MSRRRLLNIEIESENLHDANTDIADVYLDKTTGEFIQYKNWSTTDKIKVKTGDYIIKQSKGLNDKVYSDYNCIYDINDKIITNLPYVTSPITDTILHVTSGVDYIRLSMATSRLKYIEIYRIKS